MLVKVLEVIMADLDELGVEVWVLGGEVLETVLPNGIISVDTQTETSDPIPMSVRDELPNDVDALYIFTSGTTGTLSKTKAQH